MFFVFFFGGVQKLKVILFHFLILTASASDNIFVCGGVFLKIAMSYLVSEFV